MVLRRPDVWPDGDLALAKAAQPFHRFFTPFVALNSTAYPIEMRVQFLSREQLMISSTD